MGNDTKTNLEVKPAMQRWQSEQKQQMIDAGYVCAKCPDGLLILGHDDRIHCRIEGMSVDAKRWCEVLHG